LRVKEYNDTYYFETLDSANHFDAAVRPGYYDLLYLNNTDEIVYKDVQISIYNESDGGILMSPSASWAVQLDGVITYEDEPLEE
jgi:hypothetical protein